MPDHIDNTIRYTLSERCAKGQTLSTFFFFIQVIFILLGVFSIGFIVEG